jgi:hypothetical protein
VSLKRSYVSAFNLHGSLPDDPELYDGAPASIQILCRRQEEEKALSIARLVLTCLSESEIADEGQQPAKT